MAKNPYFASTPPDVADTVREHLRTIVTTFLKANSDQPAIPDAQIQALHPALALPRVYAVIKADLGL